MFNEINKRLEFIKESISYGGFEFDIQHIKKPRGVNITQKRTNNSIEFNYWKLKMEWDIFPKAVPQTDFGNKKWENAIIILPGGTVHRGTKVYHPYAKTQPDAWGRDLWFRDQAEVDDFINSCKEAYLLIFVTTRRVDN